MRVSWLCRISHAASFYGSGRTLPRVLPALLAGVLVAGGCVDRVPTATERQVAQPPVSAPSRAITEDDYTPVGSATIPVPAGGGNVSWITVGTVPAGEWMRLRVTGVLNASRTSAFVDSYCGPEVWHRPWMCDLGPSQVDPGGFDDRMNTHMQVQARVVSAQGTYMLPLGPDSDRPGEYVTGRIPWPVEGVVQVMRSGNGLLHGGLLVYNVTGSQTAVLKTYRECSRPSDRFDAWGNPCQNAKVVLTCNSRRDSVTVTRGEEVACTATTDPAASSAALVVTGWKFVGTGYTYPDAEVGDPAPTGTAWGGLMAMSGRVVVSGRVNGTADSAGVRVTVAPRQDFKKKQVQVSIKAGALADVPALGRPEDPPNDVTDLGRAIANPGISDYQPRTNLAEVLRTIRMIEDEGPNHGLAYLKEVPMQPEAVVVIHPALARGSAFYQAQAQTSNVVSGTQPCVQSRWDTYVRLVEEHEGLRGNPNSHVGVFQAEINPAAAEAVEHLVGRTDALAAMAEEWIQLLTPVAEKAKQQSSNEVFHSRPGGRVRFGCEFNFNVRGR